MKHYISLFIVFLFLSAAAFTLITGCNKDNGDRQPLPPMNITINPNSTLYQDLNIVGGWMYLDEIDGVEPPSRGVIVYRMSTDMFIAFERTPPFKPDSCCNKAKTICTALIVDFPHVIDTCIGSKFLILDGSVMEGPSNMPLSQFAAEYNGDLLFIHD